MRERRVAITGLGVVSPAGIGSEALWQALISGRRCTTAITMFDPAGLPSQVAGQLDEGFSARQYVPRSYRKAVKVMARDIQIAVAAAELAFADAGMATRAAGGDAEMTVPPERLGCNIGAALIAADLDELGAAFATAAVDGKVDLKLWGAEGMNNLTPLWLLKYLPNMLSCHVTIIHGCQGPSNAITCGDASGHLSIGQAARWIQRGSAEAAIAGGAESKVNPVALAKQCLLRRPCTSHNDSPADACRPFDAAADGTVVAEGGALLVLEEMDRACSRGARVRAEIVGFGSACDPAGLDPAAPTAGGLDLAAAAAIRDAGIGVDDIGLLVAHGTGVAAEDAAEAAAWRACLGEHMDAIPAAVVTGAVGSMFAGAGAVEVALAAMALESQTIPPAVNFSAPACDHMPGVSRTGFTGPFDYALTGAFSTGGQSAACVLKRCDQ